MSDAAYPRLRAGLRIALALFFGGAGLAHLAAPDELLKITPALVPFPRTVIAVTGVLEIVGALALLSGVARRAAGVALALYALCVWPANFKHALDGIELARVPSSWWYHGPRLAFQPVIIWAALFAAGVIDWPLRRRG